MGFTIDFSVLNQKGTPALYSDIFANRPAAGYQGRLFIATDTAAIYEDTGTAWTLIANVSSGAGTLQQVTTNGNTSNVGISVTAGGVSTNSLTDTSLTTGSVPFAGAGGLISQDNANLFWDDTNNRLGINTNTPGNSLDVHTTSTNPTIAVNNTAGNQSAISFLKTSIAKWRIGNTATDTFDIFNFILGINALSISSTNNQVSFLGSIKIQNGAGFSGTAGYGSLGSLSTGFIFQNGTSLNTMFFDFGGFTAGRTFIFPNADGTIALTADLSSYLPLTGGNLTGNLTVSVATGLSALTLNNASLSGRNWSFINTTNGADSDLSLFYSGTSGGTKVTFANNGWVGIGKTPTTTLDVLGSGLFSGSLSSNAATFTGLVTLQKSGQSLLLFATTTASNYIQIQTTGGGNTLIGCEDATGGFVAAGSNPYSTVFTSGSTKDLVLGTNSITRLCINGSTGNVLINSTTDDTVNKLQVTGSAKITSSLAMSGDITITKSSNPALILANSTTTNSFRILSADDGTFILQQTGILNLLSFTTAGVCKIFNLAGTGSRAVLADANGNLSAPVSDITVKENIEPLKYGLETIMKLNAVQFEFIESYKNYGEGLQIGAIAQEVEEIIPEAVFKTPSTGLKGIDYNQFNGIYIKAIQDQQKIIESLIQRIEALENK